MLRRGTEPRGSPGTWYAARKSGAGRRVARRRRAREVDGSCAPSGSGWAARVRSLEFRSSRCPDAPGCVNRPGCGSPGPGDHTPEARRQGTGRHASRMGEPRESARSGERELRCPGVGALLDGRASCWPEAANGAGRREPAAAGKPGGEARGVACPCGADEDSRRARGRGVPSCGSGSTQSRSPRPHRTDSAATTDPATTSSTGTEQAFVRHIHRVNPRCPNLKPLTRRNPAPAADTANPGRNPLPPRLSPEPARAPSRETAPCTGNVPRAAPQGASPRR